MLTRAVRILDAQAAAVRARIREDRADGLEPYETTLTQNLVSDLRRQLAAAGTAVYAAEIPRDDEIKLNGADLALWVRAPGGALAGVHLQAKRQYSDDTYRGLDHSNSHGRQYDMLLAGARASGARAGYAFYNGLDDPGPAGVLCTQNILTADSHGVSIADARRLAGHVAATVRRVDVERLCSPLRCLLGCGAGSAGGMAGALLAWQGRDPDAGLVDPADAPGYLLPLLARAGADRDRSDDPPDREVAGSAHPDLITASIPQADGDAGPPAYPSLGLAPDEGGPTATVLLAIPPAAFSSPVSASFQPPPASNGV